MNKHTAIEWIKALVVVAILISVVTMCVKTVDSDNERAEARVQKVYETYGLKIETWQYTKCLNGWLMLKNGTHDWVYPRDENFKPIPCGENAL